MESASGAVVWLCSPVATAVVHGLGGTPIHGRVMFTSFGFWHRSWGAVAERHLHVRLRGTGSYETAYALSPDSRK